MISLKMLLVTSFLLLGLLIPTFTFAQTRDLEVKVENIRKAQGQIMIAVFKGADNFLEDDKDIASKKALVEKKGAINISFPNLPFGADYSIAVYHDVNGNEKLDTNLFGVPTEPYGFSNNARSKWGAPKYRIARFSLNESTNKMVIQVKKWSKQ